MLINNSRGQIALFIVLVICLYAVHLEVFGAFYHWGDRLPDSPKGGCPRYSVQDGSYKRVKFSYNWKDVPTKYPVENLATLPSWSPVPPPNIQAFPLELNSTEKNEKTSRQKIIKKTFEKAWRNYRLRAWKADELKPISGKPNNNFGGWGATLVDSLDTLWIMDMKDEFLDSVKAIEAINFSPDKIPGERISTFETIIRYVGGFLSAYELSGCQHTSLLNKAVELGDMLYVAFDTPSRMPVKNWSPRAGAIGAEQHDEASMPQAPLANIGTLELEFTKLSMLTGDMKWYDAAQRVGDILEVTQNRTAVPGLWPKDVDINQFPSFQSTLAMNSDQYASAFDDAFRAVDSYSIGGEIDSAYEYIPKMAVLLGVKNPASERYLHMYGNFVEAAVKHGLFFRPLAPDNPDVLLTGTLVAQSADKKPNLRPNVEHLACFTGGMLALGSRIISSNTTEKQMHLDLAQRLTEGCAWSYAQTATGIAPEQFTAKDCPIDSLSRGECLWNENEKTSGVLPKGYTAIGTSTYLLRPEAIESVFYLWRITSEKRWMDVAWKMFESIEAVTSSEYGNSEIQDVNAKGGGGKMDHMESFWLAESLKYLYLMYADFDVVSLDEWVFNTEAHPLRIPR